jgi:RNA polymerase sigma factor (sigma-70 family)
MPGQPRDTADTGAAGQPVTGRSLADLLAGAMAGEWACWDEIVSRFGRLVTHTAARMGLSHSDAADVAQLTWMRLWEHGCQIREPDRLAAWLVCTARREAIRVASASRRYLLCADPTVEYGASCLGAHHDIYPVEQVYDCAIEQALGRLPARYRRLLELLSCDLQLSYLEVANRMGLPIGSIGPMRMRALRMLAKTPEFTSGRFAGPAPVGIAS